MTFSSTDLKEKIIYIDEDNIYRVQITVLP